MDHIYDDAPLPDEEELVLLETFGIEAVYGGKMNLTDMRRLLMVKRLLGGFYAREASGDFAKWAERNPDANELLTWAERMYNDGAKNKD